MPLRCPTISSDFSSDEGGSTDEGGEQTVACSAVVSPDTFCGTLSAFVLDSSNSYARVDEDLVSFEETLQGVSATFNFSGTSNIGYIQLNFGELVYIDGVSLTAYTSSTEGIISATVENLDGSIGCKYSLDSPDDSLSSYSSSDYCWGDTTYAPLEGDAAGLINVRLSTAGIGESNLSITYFYISD